MHVIRAGHAANANLLSCWQVDTCAAMRLGPDSLPTVAETRKVCQVQEVVKSYLRSDSPQLAHMLLQHTWHEQQLVSTACSGVGTRCTMTASVQRCHQVGR